VLKTSDIFFCSFLTPHCGGGCAVSMVFAESQKPSRRQENKAWSEPQRPTLSRGSATPQHEEDRKGAQSDPAPATADVIMGCVCCSALRSVHTKGRAPPAHPSRSLCNRAQDGKHTTREPNGNDPPHFVVVGGLSLGPRPSVFWGFFVMDVQK